MNRVRMNHTFSMRSHEGLITGAAVKRGSGCLLGDETVKDQYHSLATD